MQVHNTLNNFYAECNTSLECRSLEIWKQLIHRYYSLARKDNGKAIVSKSGKQNTTIAVFKEKNLES